MKSIIVAGLLLGCAHGVQAGENYVQTELNSTIGGDSTTEIHVGRQGGVGNASWFVQGGPVITSTSSSDSTDLSVKVGGAVTDVITHGLDFYGEASAVSGSETTWATKVGAKYHFH
jgi:hypothetical protein|tara:strand:- start:242 stop:589 length:348 start_codon:yes stop_codon:yes gene_type:complete